MLENVLRMSNYLLFLEDLVGIIGIKDKHKIIDLSRKLGTVETLTESRIHCKLEEKDLYLYYFLAIYPGRTLIFCNSIDCVRRLRSILSLLGYDPLPLHASMHQRQRLKNLDRFASKDNSLLLATDVAARGLDIVGIEHVVHYQVPRTAEIYVHRSGRTARAMKEGLSLMLIEPKESFYYRQLCKALNRDQDLPLFPLDMTLLKPIQERIALVHRIDKIEHTNRKRVAENSWLQHAVKEMDIELDEDEMTKLQKGGSNKELTVLKKQLDSLLKKSLRLQGYCGSHITKSGKLSLGQDKITNWKKLKEIQSV
ncbi:ATP-dependent RNA helicase DDX24-like [Centruroides sculpturatus]|uniref:ATP-dependent RNA helicase DDX24-like n=1 Tax=Centruroides sculpturatus TaxID=218467 RepID=UPI000C6D728E|nr:ATP-dependent RNA helicase DDX24-like [Centruroides sculpturatus]